MSRLVGFRWWSLLMGIALLVGLSACSRPHDDAQMANEVRGRIASDGAVRSRDLNVQVSNGVVTLSGSSQSDPERMAAAADAAQVSGVRTVINDLQVRTPAASVAPAPSQAAPQPVTAAAVANPPAVAAVPQPELPMANPARASETEMAAHAQRRSKHLPIAHARVLRAVAQTQSGLPYVTGAKSAPATANSGAAPVPSSSPAANTSAQQAKPAPAAAPASAASAAPAAPAPAPAKVLDVAKVVAPAPPKPVTVPSGTTLSIRLVDKIDSSHSQSGQTFRATLDAPIADESGAIVIPAGQDVTGRIVEANSAGRLTGKSSLALELTGVSANGRQYTLHTDQIRREGKSEGVSTAKKAGGGAALGALIGAIAGGGKGAAIGAVLGAGAGAGVSGMKKGKPVVLPSETLLSFSLQDPLSVVPSTAQSQTAAKAQPQSAATEATAESDTAATPGDDNGPPVLKRRNSGSQPK